MQYFHQEGGGRTPGTPYAGSATDYPAFVKMIEYIYLGCHTKMTYMFCPHAIT